ncbi:MAG: DUF2378 family protein [Polyangiaceae bacterium]|nr:DUF2378 family protein [Polyangiaceae bacterium]
MLGFEAFDVTAACDPRPVLEGTPAHHNIRGVQFNVIQRALHEKAERVAFKLYPMRDYNVLCLRAAETLFPRLGLGESLWRVGGFAVKGFSESLAGKTFMTLAAGHLQTAVRAMPRAYRLTQDVGNVEVIEVNDQRMVIGIRDVWHPIPFHVGLLEAACAFFGQQADVSVRQLDLGNLDVCFENVREL